MSELMGSKMVLLCPEGKEGDRGTGRRSDMWPLGAASHWVISRQLLFMALRDGHDWKKRTLWAHRSFQSTTGYAKPWLAQEECD